MTNAVVPLNITQNNASVPYIVSSMWNYINSDIIVDHDDVYELDPKLTFSYLQGFYDSSLSVTPVLAVWSGQTNPDGSLILNEVQFAYSGQPIQIKGIALIASGNDIRNTAIVSRPINAAAPTTSFLKVKAWGGMY